MSEALDYPEGATPPDPRWTWWNGLDVAAPTRQPATPTLIDGGGFHAFDRLEDLAAALAARLAGRTPVLTRSVASYPEFDTFPAFSVYAQAEGAASAPAALWVACVAIQKTKADELEAAIAAAAQQPKPAHAA